LEGEAVAPENLRKFHGLGDHAETSEKIPPAGFDILG
jgi:hypothetical protein